MLEWKPKGENSAVIAFDRSSLTSSFTIILTFSGKWSWPVYFSGLTAKHKCHFLYNELAIPKARIIVPFRQKYNAMYAIHINQATLMAHYCSDNEKYLTKLYDWEITIFLRFLESLICKPDVRPRQRIIKNVNLISELWFCTLTLYTRSQRYFSSIAIYNCKSCRDDDMMIRSTVF